LAVRVAAVSLRGLSPGHPRSTSASTWWARRATPVRTPASLRRCPTPRRRCWYATRGSPRNRPGGGAARRCLPAPRRLPL